jgi:hypothetical protein
LDFHPEIKMSTRILRRRVARAEVNAQLSSRSTTGIGAFTTTACTFVIGKPVVPCWTRISSTRDPTGNE